MCCNLNTIITNNTDFLQMSNIFALSLPIFPLLRHKGGAGVHEINEALEC